MLQFGLDVPSSSRHAKPEPGSEGMKRCLVIGVLALAVTTGVACGDTSPVPTLTPAPPLAVALLPHRPRPLRRRALQPHEHSNPNGHTKAHHHANAHTDTYTDAGQCRGPETSAGSTDANQFR